MGFVVLKLMFKSSHNINMRVVCIYIANIVFNIVKYFIAAVAEITSGVVNQWLLLMDARIVLKWITKSCKVLMGVLLSSRHCNAAVVGKLTGFEGLAKHTGA